MSPPAQDNLRRAHRPRGWWRGLTGAFAAGLVALALAVLAAQLFGWDTGAEGPGVVPVLGHLAGGGLALAAQHVADRTQGRSAALAGVVVVLLTFAVLWFFWWA